MKDLTDNSPGVELPAIVKDPIEKLYLYFLKCNLGVGRKTRKHLRYPISMQVLSYFNRPKT